MGSLFPLYFIETQSMRACPPCFPCIWAAGGVFFYGIAVLLHLNSRHGVLAGFSLPPVIKNSLIVLAALCILVFLTVEALIFTGMFHHPSENLDYLVVLGAQVNGTKLSNSLRLRVERAGEYLEENPETKAVLSGGKGTGEDITEAEAMYRYMEKKGISPERLLKEEHSTNTSENLKFSLEIIDKKEDNRGKEASIGVVYQQFSCVQRCQPWEKAGMQACGRNPGKKQRVFTGELSCERIFRGPEGQSSGKYAEAVKTLIFSNRRRRNVKNEYDQR